MSGLKINYPCHIPPQKSQLPSQPHLEAAFPIDPQKQNEMKRMLNSSTWKLSAISQSFWPS